MARPPGLQADQYRRDEYQRLSWVVREVRAHAAGWQAHAARLGDGPERRRLLACAAEVDEVVAASHVPGGPRVDHLAEARWHLEQLDAERRRGRASAGEPVGGTCGNPAGQCAYPCDNAAGS